MKIYSQKNGKSSQSTVVVLTLKEEDELISQLTNGKNESLKNSVIGKKVFRNLISGWDAMCSCNTKVVKLVKA